MKDSRHGNFTALIISFTLDEPQYHFHGSVIKTTDFGFDVEFVTKFKIAAQLFFGLLVCVMFFM